jgi:GntR family transcriptional repressor for pyruvate dehydrogenase complex
MKPEDLVIAIHHEFIENRTVGESLPSENSLATYFDVSRLKIREALKILIGQTLVTSSKGRRSRIASEHSNLLQYVVTISATSNGNWLKDLCHVRMALETEAASIVSSSHNSLNLEKPKIALSQMSELAREIESNRRTDRDVGALIKQYQVADLEFHKSLVEASHNVTISLFYSSLSTLLQQSFQLTQNVALNPGKDFCANIEIHQLIFDNIEEGNPVIANRIIRDHMKTVQTQLESAFRKSFAL